MSRLEELGSDTGIRTRVSAVRGRRPGPLDDIANAVRSRLRCVRHSFKCSHATTRRASNLLPIASILLPATPLLDLSSFRAQLLLLEIPYDLVRSLHPQTISLQRISIRRALHLGRSDSFSRSRLFHRP